jgi:tetratricopeptide (TPR) repeat protein
MPADHSVQAVSGHRESWLFVEHHAIPPSLFLKIFQGVVSAQDIPQEVTGHITSWIGQEVDADTIPSLSLHEWYSRSSKKFAPDSGPASAINLTLAILFLRHNSHTWKSGHIPSDVIDFVWKTIRTSLASPVCHGQCIYGAQGFLAVHLCSILTDGHQIDELYRLHLWLPDGKRGPSEYRIHSHQASACSWILAGEATDLAYNIEPINDDYAAATHAKYAIKQNFTKVAGETQPQRTSSTLFSTGELVKVALHKEEIHGRNSTYSMTAGSFHTTEVPTGKLHATLFLFDSSRGWELDAGVLGPKEGREYTHHRYPHVSVDVDHLLQSVDDMRAWEALMAEGAVNAARGAWEEALERFDRALALAFSSSTLRAAPLYAGLAQMQLGATNRRFGRYEIARKLCIQSLENIPESHELIDAYGELGVVYRHMDNLHGARDVLRKQYETAKKLDHRAAACRAIGNIGMVNYQLHLLSPDPTLLQLATKQLEERVQRAQNNDNAMALTWEIVGHSRLSLCYLSSSRTDLAVATARCGLLAAERSADANVVAFSRFFLGHALLADGQRERALEQFNIRGACSPAMAMCKEPSPEHRGYLRELIENGADLDLEDNIGYTALDYAVFSGDEEARDLLISGLARTLPPDAVSFRVAESKARKCYRVVLQETLRPNLTAAAHQSPSRLVREAYLRLLKTDKETRGLFDRLRYVRFADFRENAKIPGFRDGLTRDFEMAQPGKEEGQGNLFIIFISYRWLRPLAQSSATAGPVSPDDANGTQFHRMVAAVDALLTNHPSIDQKDVALWIVSIGHIQAPNQYPSVDRSSHQLTTPRTILVSTNKTRCQE